MPQSYSYWRRVDFVRSDTLIRSAIARWRLAGIEWLRAIFAIFLAPVPAGRCRERPGSSPAVVPPRRPSFVLLFTSHGTSVQLLKSTPALRPVFLVPARARIATHSCAHATAYPANPEWFSRSFCSLSAARQGVSGPRVVQPFIFTRYPLPGGRIRTASGPDVHLHSLSAAKKAYPDPEWSSRSSSLATRRQEGVSDPGRSSRSSSFSIRCQEGVSGIPGGPAVHLTRYPPPGRRIRTPSGPAVHLYSPSAARKAYPDRGWFRRSSSLAIRHQEGVSGSRVVQAFTLTRYPPPGRRIGTPSGPGVHLHSLSAARKAYPDPEWSRRSPSLAIRLQEGGSGPRVSSRSFLLAIRRQEGVSGPPVVHPFIFSRYPPPGGRFRTATGPGDYLHSLSAAMMPHPDPEWSNRSSSLAIRHQEGVSGPRVVQAFIRTRYPPPERRIGTPSAPVVHLHSLSAARKAYPDPGWSSRSSSLAVRLQEGVSGPRVIHTFIFTRYPPPGRRIRTRVVQAFIRTRYPPPERRIGTPSGPVVHLHSLSAARKAYPDPGWSSVHLHSLSASRKAYPDPEWSSRSSSLAIRCQEGVSGPRVVQPFIFTRYPPPGRRIRTPSGPGVHLHPLSAARKAYPDHERSRCLSSLAIRCQEGVSGPPVVQPFIFTRYPPPGRRTGTPSVQPFIFTRYPPPGRRIGTPSGPSVHLQSLSAARRAVPDRDWSRRSSSFVYPPPGRRIRSRGANRSS